MASVSTTKSTSNWLERLRLSRGFPTGDEPDLDRFLSTSSSSGSAPTAGSTHSESTQSQPAIRERRFSGGRNEEQWVGRVSNVLSELFNMGEGSSRSYSKKKGSRKQANPRFCSANESNNELCSSDDLRRDKSENGLASSGDNSLNERREKGSCDVVKDAKFDGEEAEEREEDVDLKQYSRNEVFVIDTSLSDWKFDGWVFRKNDEWKIKEKKGKSRVCGGKKRKLLVSALNNEKLDKDDQKRTKKTSDDQEGLNKGQPQNDRKEQSFKENTFSLGKVSQKRCPCPRPPDKSGNESSSVILLKSIPLNPSNGAPKLGKTALKKRPKQMKIV